MPKKAFTRKKAILAIRRIGQSLFRFQADLAFIFPDYVRERYDIGRRRHIGGIHLLQSIRVRQDLSQLRGKQFFLGRRQVQTGQRGDRTYGFPFQLVGSCFRHGHFPKEKAL